MENQIENPQPQEVAVENSPNLNTKVRSFNVWIILLIILLLLSLSVTAFFIHKNVRSEEKVSNSTDQTQVTPNVTESAVPGDVLLMSPIRVGFERFELLYRLTDPKENNSVSTTAKYIARNLKSPNEEYVLFEEGYDEAGICGDPKIDTESFYNQTQGDYVKILSSKSCGDSFYRVVMGFTAKKDSKVTVLPSYRLDSLDVYNEIRYDAIGWNSPDTFIMKESHFDPNTGGATFTKTVQIKMTLPNAIIPFE